MESVGLQEYLDALPFPAFVLDSQSFHYGENETPTVESIRPVLLNKAACDEKLGELVANEIRGNPSFRKWLCLFPLGGTAATGQECFETEELELTFNFLRDRYKVVTSRRRKKIRAQIAAETDKTPGELMDRRLKLLREIGQKLRMARSTSEFWNTVILVLEGGQQDLPGCVAYAVQNPVDAVLEVVGQIGLIGGHEFFPNRLDLKALSNVGIEQYLPRVAEGETVLLEDHPVFAAFESRGDGGVARQGVIIAIAPSTTRPPSGLLFLVLSPIWPYDEDYALYLELLTKVVSHSLVNVQLLEGGIQRAQEILDVDQKKGQELERVLEQRTKELHATQGFMSRLAEICPIGIFVSDDQGNFSFVNETWYEITRYQRDLDPSQWISHIHPDDIAPVADAWKRVLQGPPQISCEFRWLHLMDDRESSQDRATWCSMAAAPEIDTDGNVVRVFGVIVDISDRKRSESEQRRRLEEAVELKRQQENFVDMTSHEMRNPLSAILQASDTARQSLERVKGNLPRSGSPPELEDALQAIGMIELCANHQKRIIDDTLTMSKLDSRLLLVTPVDTQPTEVVKKVMRMFESDFVHNGIKAQFLVHQSYHTNNINWVKADPSRFTQVLVNLLTNAIKFTAGRPVREIIVTLGPVSKRRPNLDQTVQISSPHVSPLAEKGVLFLSFSVSDTGKGLSNNERALLFQRFTQASPETHVNYGGSGLGLYISRTLTELQGGQITVQSRLGEGSTFSFYIKVKRGNPSTPAAGGNLDPTAVAAEELTNARTEASFLHGDIRQGHATKRRQRYRPVSLETPTYHILIVEDNVLNQQVLAKQLELVNCTCAIAANGADGIRALTTSKFSKNAPSDYPSFDVCLMDLEMPVMSGFVACRRIRDLESSGEFVRRVPIIAVTAHARQEQIDHMIAEGFDEVLTKPFRVAQLLKMIEGLLVRIKEQDSSDQ